MSEALKLYDLHPSPNNMKARVALAYKGLKVELVPVSSQDRSQVVEVSGQPLTPVLKHGDVVIFDSGAILRYLDANFRNTPRLFSADYATMTQIETWEKFGRGELMEPTGIVFRQLMASSADRGELDRASRLLHERTARIEDRLKEGDWLVGDSMTAADVTCAPAVYYGLELPNPGNSPLISFFNDGLRLGEGRERTKAWVRRVMRYDA